MNSDQSMKERIHRVEILIRELGYEISQGDSSEESYSTTCTTPDGFEIDLFIDSESQFLELSFTFVFSGAMADFVRERIEDIMHAAYEFGCYYTLQVDNDEITYSLFAKIYFSGLNYLALKETIQDFREAVEANREILNIDVDEDQGVSHGDT